MLLWGQGSDGRILFLRSERLVKKSCHDGRDGVDRDKDQGSDDDRLKFHAAHPQEEGEACVVNACVEAEREDLIEAAGPIESRAQSHNKREEKDQEKAICAEQLIGVGQ